jgi:hypothetical protein
VARQGLETHRGVEAMKTRSDLFPTLGRHVQEQQPHTQDLPHPLALEQRIHQQDPTQPLTLVLPVNGEMADSDAAVATNSLV